MLAGADLTETDPTGLRARPRGDVENQMSAVGQEQWETVCDLVPGNRQGRSGSGFSSRGRDLHETAGERRRVDDEPVLVPGRAADVRR